MTPRPGFPEGASGVDVLQILAEQDLPTLPEVRVAVYSDAIPGRNGVGTFYDDLVGLLRGHVGAIRVISPARVGSEDVRGLALPMPGDPTQNLFLPPIRSIWREMRDWSPTLVLSATPGAYGFLGLLHSRRLKVPFCLGYHTEFPRLMATYYPGLLGWPVRTFVAWWDRWLVRRADLTLVPNEELLRVVQRFGATEARLMGTPTPARFLTLPEPPPPTRIRRVAFVGRLAPEKQLDQVIEAAERHPGVDFRILGDGPERNLVEAGAERLANLFHTAWADREGVREIIDSADVVVLPSRHETFGSAAFEAMVRGRLALVSPSCGISEWSDLTRGLLVMGEGERLSDALGRVRALGPTELEELAAEARRASRALIRRTGRGWLSMLRELSVTKARR